MVSDTRSLHNILFIFISEAKANSVHMKQVSVEADALLDETLRYTAELERMMAEVRSRRVDEL